MLRAIRILPFLLTVGCAVSALLISPRAHATCSIKITSAYTCDQNGNTFKPQVGDPYDIRFNWTVTGTPAKPYEIAVTMANQSYTFTGITAGAGSWWIYYGWSLPLTGPVPYSIVIDPLHVTGNITVGKAKYSGTFTPVAPPRAVQYFAPDTYNGSETMTIDWVDGEGSVTSGYTLLGAPATGSYQTVNELEGPTGSTLVTTNPSNDTVWQTPITPFSPVAGYDTTSVTDFFNVTLSAARVNQALLEKATWAEIAALPASYDGWLTPDTLTQSTDPTITAYVATILPSNYKTTMTPYDCAEAIFLAIDKDITYEAVDPNGSSVATLATKAGDCGGMSDLYDACMRSIGIPSRMDCGFWIGTDVWHCFSEFYLPNCGWVPADTSQDREWWDQSGTYPYMFGADPFLNEIVVVGRGTDHSTSQWTVSATQVGWFFYYGSAAYDGITDSSSLTAAE